MSETNNVVPMRMRSDTAHSELLAALRTAEQELQTARAVMQWAEAEKHKLIKARAKLHLSNAELKHASAEWRYEEAKIAEHRTEAERLEQIALWRRVMVSIFGAEQVDAIEAAVNGGR